MAQMEAGGQIHEGPCLDPWGLGFLFRGLVVRGLGF